MIEKFDQETANTVGKEMYEALKAAAEQLGLKVRHVSGRYDDGSLKETYEFKVADADGMAFRKHARAYGFEPEDLGKSFEVQGEKFTIIGLRTERTSRPIVIRRESDGAVRVAPEDMVKRAVTGIDPYEERIKANLAGLKKGDRGLLVDIAPKYLQGLFVDVLSVSRKDKVATVKLVHESWDTRVQKRLGDRPFGVSLGMLDKMSGGPVSARVEPHEPTAVTAEVVSS